MTSQALSASSFYTAKDYGAFFEFGGGQYPEIKLELELERTRSFCRTRT